MLQLPAASSLSGNLGGDLGEDLGDQGTLVVEDQRFAIVQDWVIGADISDAAFRVYALLLRFGNSSGCRMPSRALLGRRLHRSVDSIDRALRELSSAGLVRVERRKTGTQFLSNRHHVRTSSPTATGGGRNDAATPQSPPDGGRRSAATPGRRSATRVAAEVRHYPDVSTETQPPPPGRTGHSRQTATAGPVVEVDSHTAVALSLLGY